MIICKRALNIKETLLISNIIENNGFSVVSIVDAKEEELPFAIFAVPKNTFPYRSPSHNIRCIETMIREMPKEVLSEMTKQSVWNNCIKN